MKSLLPTMAAALTAFLPATSHAQTIINASDSANNYSSWPQSANNGTGFGSWTYNNVTPNGGYSGQFLGSSYTGNGGGINSANGNAFGFYANGGTYAQAQATAPFSAGALAAGQTFSVQMQDHYIGDTGGQEGFSLQNSSGGDLLQFYFNGGSSDYYLNIWTGSGTSVQVDTGVGYTSSPLTLEYTQGSGNNWSFTILEGSATMATLTSAGTGDQIWENGVSQVGLYSLNGGNLDNQNDNVFFNNLGISTVPEPSTMALGAAGMGLLLRLRRRR